MTQTPICGKMFTPTLLNAPLEIDGLRLFQRAAKKEKEEEIRARNQANQYAGADGFGQEGKDVKGKGNGKKGKDVKGKGKGKDVQGKRGKK